MSEIELPSLEKIQEMEIKRSQAIEALEISGEYVKCQRCGTAVPVARGLGPPRARNIKITTIKIRIKWIEDHYSPNIRDNKKITFMS